MKKQFPFRDRTCMVLMVLIVLTLVGWYGSSYGGAEEKKFLADRHQTKGIACASCHKESPPKAAVPTAVCIGCHGSYAKIAEKTINVSPNPHVSHMGELSCESCHHAHKASENHCSSCHEFGFKVP
jgi:Cytochrome c3